MREDIDLNQKLISSPSQTMKTLGNLLKFLWKIGRFFILHFFLMGLSIAFVKQNTIIAYILSFITFFLLTITFFVWYKKIAGKDTFTFENISCKTWKLALLLCISDYMLITVFYGYPVIPNYVITTEYIILNLFAVTGGPFVEEILFRGLFQKHIFKKKPWTSIFISSILFSAWHYDKIPSIIPAFFTGLFCGVIYYKTDKLIICILFHSLVNILSVLSRYEFNYIPTLQFLTLILATYLAVYAIRRLMNDDKTLNLEISSHNIKKNEKLN